MADEHARPETAADEDGKLREELVAYLDGELSADESRRIEDLLASDAGVRRMLQQLDRTWHLLDELDAPEVEAQFTHTTLEMVAVAAADDAAKARAEAPRRRRRRRLLIAGGLLAAVLVGFLAVASLVPDPNRQLLRDLPMLEDLDEYQQVDDIGFLRLLAQHKLFPAEADEGQPAAVGDDSPAARRARLEAMTPAQQEDILHHQKEFPSLPRDQQQRIRRLHEQLQNDPDRERLHEVMGRYCHWLATLPLIQRAKLQRAKPEERIAQIKTIQQERKDRQVLVRWMEARRGTRTKGRDFRENMRLSEKDLSDLRSQLSPEGRARLEHKSIDEQRAIVRVWLAQPEPGWFRGWGRRGPPPAFDEKLVSFFEHDLSDKQRDELLSVPADQTQQRLRDLYQAHQAKAKTKPLSPPFFRPEWRSGKKSGGERGPARKGDRSQREEGDAKKDAKEAKKAPNN